MIRRSLVVVAALLIAAPALLAGPPRARTVELDAFFAGGIDEHEKLSIDLENATFVRTFRGVRQTGRITERLRSEIDAALDATSDHAEQIIVQHTEFGDSRTITIEGGSASSRVPELERALLEARGRAREDWRVLGGSGEDMTPYFDEAPKRFFLPSTFSERVEDKPASARARDGFKPALYALSSGAPLRAIGEALATLRAKVDPEGFNRSAVLAAAHLAARYSLNGDVTDEQILRRVEALHASDPSTELALPRTRRRGLTDALGERVRGAESSSRDRAR